MAIVGSQRPPGAVVGSDLWIQDYVGDPIQAIVRRSPSSRGIWALNPSP
ncbi:uncharacterized protein METZ01_LOCUS499263, partial [marine metagenome]